ncbi:necrosis inducing protein [Lasiosphaeria hispida]|uniref:Necrosis inducing protein n=1 Tax=Lasiosphaeria hispida TaxID=260671 RepID=A0AAJ0M942_9PEZI|nr:necrosis inducing protein [Lasiosphaeria hispida]
MAATTSRPSGATATFAEGMEPKGSGQGGCRDEVDLDKANVYSRRHCSGDWCVAIYDYYFEKDVALSTDTGGHRHDWEHIAVWTRGSTVEYVAASAHGGYHVKSRKDVLFSYDQDGEHPLMVYHKDGASTHAFRFATAKDVAKVENRKGVFWRGILVGWEGFPNVGLRDALMGHNWGGGQA